MKTYLDLGCYQGETTDAFLRLSPDCTTVIGFDLVAYPKEWAEVKARHPNVSISFNQMAVGTTDGISTFGAWPENPQAQTCYPECVNYKDRPLQQVPRLDFVGWLQRFAQPGNTIICKMDIEGAEYEILEGLIKTGAISLIQHIQVEFHGWIFPAEYAAREKWIRDHCPIEIGGWG